jgi:ribosomal protein S6--L-glutamate ligase
MRIVSYNLFRTLGLSGATYLKPEHFLANPMAHQSALTQADWVLYPEYWQLNSLLYAFNCRIFPSEASYRIGHNKVEMTRALQAIVPQHLPYTLIAANTDENAEQLWQSMTLPFVAKVPKASQGLGVWLIEHRKSWQRYLLNTDTLYVQEYLPIDKDLRIILVGGQIVSAYWRHQSESSFHTNVSRGGSVSYGDIPETALELVRMVGLRLGINHAGFDVAMVDGHPYIFEFNRLFGNQGTPGGGATLIQAIEQYLLVQTPDHHPTRPGNQPGPGAS